MQIGIFERSSGRMIFSEFIQFDVPGFEPADWQYCDEAWRRAVSAGVVRIEDLPKYEVRPCESRPSLIREKRGHPLGRAQPKPGTPDSAQSPQS